MHKCLLSLYTVNISRKKKLLYPFSRRWNFLWITSFHWHQQHAKDNFAFLKKCLFLRNIICPSPFGVIMYGWMRIMGSQRWELTKTQYVSREPETKNCSKNFQSLSCFLTFVTYFISPPLSVKCCFSISLTNTIYIIMSMFTYFYIELLRKILLQNLLSLHGKFLGLRLIELDLIKCLPVFQNRSNLI